MKKYAKHNSRKDLTITSKRVMGYRWAQSLLLLTQVAFVLLSLITECWGDADGKEAPSLVENSVPLQPGKNVDTDITFIGGFSASLYVILISELGDKTFFIAAIMSMQHPRCIIYSGAMLALATMTVLSAMLGFATTVIPRRYVLYASGLLFLLFGLKMLYDAWKMLPDDAKEEYEEVKSQILSNSDPEIGYSDPTVGRFNVRRRVRTVFRSVFDPILVEAFILTFLAEWGDRSQLTTIVLAATKSASGVIVGGILGHMVCTGLAVLMGRAIAQRIPVKWLTYIGGLTFIGFAAWTFLGSLQVDPEPTAAVANIKVS